MTRRCLPWIALLGAALSLAGMARTPLPAQDGLKFIRVARQFQTLPWTDVVRGSDQHPLYPGCVALVQPLAARLVGSGPDSWRIAAQGVSAVAALVLLLPLFALTRALFDEPTAAFAALLFVLLPVPAAIARETLSDALALLAFMSALQMGEYALRTNRLAAAVGCGVVAGLGYWTRPEVAVVPVAVVGTAGLRHAVERCRPLDLAAQTRRPMYRFAALGVAFLFMIGMYAIVKGEVSEKLALRRTASLASTHDAPGKAMRRLPSGLDDPRWDFAPKEESGHATRLPPLTTLRKLASGWAEGLGWVFAPLALLGAWRVGANAGKQLIIIYMILFTLILVRHASILGYLSGRHALTLVAASLPWAAAGSLSAARRLSAWFARDEGACRRPGVIGVLALIAAGATVQALKPGHPSRWGHAAAGRWLAERMGPADAVLDTRGWAAFVSDRPNYDYWHIGQALSDPYLAYVVVERDELTAASRRAATLGAVLAFAAEPAASFPERRGGRGADVQVFRFRRTESWEAMRP